MTNYRLQPLEFTAHQWHRNGDHPDDGPADREGRVVRYFRRPEPEYAGDLTHETCGRTWHEHGWIDGPDDGLTVCPGDFIANIPGSTHIPVRPDVFAAIAVRTPKIQLPYVYEDVDGDPLTIATTKAGVPTGETFVLLRVDEAVYVQRDDAPLIAAAILAAANDEDGQPE